MRAGIPGRAVVIGLVALVVTAAALAAGLKLWRGPHDRESFRAGDLIGPGEVCLKTDIAMIDGLAPGCYPRAALAAFRDRPVFDARGLAAALSLAHPTDAMAPLAIVRTCAEYREKSADGWFAFSSRAMRREAFFRRACGVLDMLAWSRDPDASYFEEGAAALADIEALAASGAFGLAEGSPKAPPGSTTSTDDAAPAISVRADAPGVWALSWAEDRAAVVQEIAHADFNADGAGDILVFIALGARGATGLAAASRLGFLEKVDAEGPARFTPYDPAAQAAPAQ